MLCLYYDVIICLLPRHIDSNCFFFFCAQVVLKECFIPLNPLRFSSDILEAMDRTVPSQMPTPVCDVSTHVSHGKQVNISTYMCWLKLFEQVGEGYLKEILGIV